MREKFLRRSVFTNETPNTGPFRTSVFLGLNFTQHIEDTILTVQ